MKSFSVSALALAAALGASAQPLRHGHGNRHARLAKRIASDPEGSCFPDVKRSIPSEAATADSLHGGDWWCGQNEEYAFMGFSYDVTACQGYDQLLHDFTNMRETYSARYVRIYSACDADDFNDNMVNAAAEAGLGVYALVWFGFDGSDAWKTRMEKLIETVHSNRNASYVIRNVAVGSEPLMDGVLPIDDLAAQVKSVHDRLSSFGIQSTVSEISYEFEDNGNAPALFDAMDLGEADILPFLSEGATTGANAWPKVLAEIEYYQQHTKGKYLRISQTGWPSNTEVWKSQESDVAMATDSSEEEYFNLLNSKCEWFKSQSIGWFAHIYEDNTLPGWGIVKDGNPKFNFKPKTRC